MDSDEDRVTVKRVVWSLEPAEREVERLNGLNSEKDSLHFWQCTRVDPPGSDT